MMTSTGGALRAGAAYVTRFLSEQAQLHYDEVRLQLESQLVDWKRLTENTTPYIVATGLGKVCSSFERTHFIQNPFGALPNLQADGHQHAHVEPLRAKHAAASRRHIIQKKGIALTEQSHRLRLITGRQAVFLRATTLRKTHSRRLKQQDSVIRKIDKRSHLTSQPFSTSLLLWARSYVVAKNLERRPIASMRSKLTANYDPMTATHVERQRFIGRSLTSTIGKERMHAPIFPSGHSGIDPVIANHNQEVATMNLLKQHDAWRTEQHRQFEEQQRQLVQEEQNRLKIQTLLGHYRARYVERMERLISFGPPMRRALDALDLSLQSNNMTDAANVVRAMTAQILEPVYAVMLGMNREIPLEEVGAKHLKFEWPIDSLDRLYIRLEGEPWLPDELIYLAQGIEAVRKPIDNPTPFVDPLAPEPTPLHDFRWVHNGGNKTVSTGVNQVSNNSVWNRATSSAPAQSTAATHERNYSSFDDMVTQNKANNKANADFKNSQSVLAVPTNQIPSQAPIIKVHPPTPTGPSTSANLQSLIMHCDDKHAEFGWTVDDLVSGSGTLSLTSHNDVDRHLRILLGMTNGKQRLLKNGQGLKYKTQVERVIGKIDRLVSGRTQKRAQDLKRLAEDALDVWA